jgi:hypothetical protein
VWVDTRLMQNATVSAATSSLQRHSEVDSTRCSSAAR